MKTQYKWAIAAASALLIGIVSVQQTGALWRDTAEVPGGTISAGILDISAGGDGVKQFDLSGLKLENKSVGDSVQAELPVLNSGNVAMGYDLTDVVISDGAPQMGLRVGLLGEGQECISDGSEPGGTELYAGTMDGAGFTEPQFVEAGSTQTLCLMATIGADSEPNQSGDATFTFTASSVSH